MLQMGAQGSKALHIKCHYFTSFGLASFECVCKESTIQSEQLNQASLT